jgi:hypothetical protein
MEVQLPSSSSIPRPDALSDVHVDPPAPRLLGVVEGAVAGPIPTLEPDEVPLPTTYPGRRLRAVVRDPRTVWVSWENLEPGEIDGWEIVALDAGGQAMASFRAQAGATGAYLQLPSARLRRVVLRALREDQPPAAVAVTSFAPPAPAIATEAGAAPWVSVTRDEVFGDLFQSESVGPLPVPSAGAAPSATGVGTSSTQVPAPSSHVHAPSS